MSYQDLSIYTQEDIGDYIVISPSTKMTATALPCNIHNYAYYDHGAEVFNASFVQDMHIKIFTVFGSPVCVPWMLANTAASYAQLVATNEDFLVIQINSSNEWYLRQFDSGSDTTVWETMTANTDYWITITRDDDFGTYGKITVDFYLDSDRTIWERAMSIELTERPPLKYHYCVSSYEFGSVATQTLTVQDVDFNFTGVADGVVILRRRMEEY